jgi:hypothetical protein
MEEERGNTAFCPEMSRLSYNQKIGSEIMRALYGAVREPRRTISIHSEGF